MSRPRSVTLRDEILETADKLIERRGYALPRQIVNDLSINIEMVSAVLSGSYPEIPARPYWTKVRNEDGGRTRWRRVYARRKNKVPEIIGYDNLPELS